MIITVQGTNGKMNSSPCVVGVLATLNAISQNRKTLILQLIDRSPNYCIESMMYHTDDKGNGMEFSSLLTGIDALCRHKETGRATKDTFEDYCKSLLTQDNLLDIAESTNKAEFVRELDTQERKSAIFGLLEDAKHIYDDIYILLAPISTSTYAEICEKADVNIICVPQSNEKVLKKTEKTRIVVTDYDNTSMYAIKYLQKHHGVKNIYVMPHNIGFKDAKISGTLLDFVTKNKNDDKSDINFRFMDSMYKLLGSVTGKEVVITNDYEDTINKKPYYKTFADLKKLNAENVRKITVKNGLFGKPTTKTVIEKGESET